MLTSYVLTIATYKKAPQVQHRVDQTKVYFIHLGPKTPAWSKLSSRRGGVGVA